MLQSNALSKALDKGSYIRRSTQLAQLYGGNVSMLVGYLTSLTLYHGVDVVFHSYEQFDEHIGLKRVALNKAIKVLVDAGLMTTGYTPCKQGHRVRTFQLNAEKLGDVIVKQREANAAKKKAYREETFVAVERICQGVEEVTRPEPRKVAIIDNPPVYGDTSMFVTGKLEAPKSEIYKFALDFIDEMHTEFDTKIFDIPRGDNTKRMKDLEKFIKLFCDGKFYQKLAWDSQWIEKSKLDEDDHLFTRCFTVDQFKEFLSIAVRNYQMARSDRSYVFYGDRDATISLTDFLYDSRNGISKFWYWFRTRPVQGINIEWAKQYYEKVPEGLRFNCYDENTDKESYLIGLARIVKHYLDKKAKGELEYGYMNTPDNFKLRHVLEELASWMQETGSMYLPYPGIDNQRWKQFNKHLSEMRGGFRFRYPKKGNK